MQQHIGNGWGFFVDIERYGIDFSRRQKVYICLPKPKPEIKKCKNSFQSLNMIKRVDTRIETPVVVDIDVTVVPKPCGKKRNFEELFFASLCLSGLIYIVMNW